MRRFTYDRKSCCWSGRIGRVEISSQDLREPRPKNGATAPSDVVASLAATGSRWIAQTPARVRETAQLFADAHAKQWCRDGRASLTAAAFKRQAKLVSLSISVPNPQHEHVFLGFAPMPAFEDHAPRIFLVDGAVYSLGFDRPVDARGRSIGRWDERLVVSVAAQPSPRSLRLTKRRAVKPNWTKALRNRRGAIEVGTRSVAVHVSAASASAATIDARLGQLLGSMGDVVDETARQLATLYNDSWVEDSPTTPAKVKRAIRLATIELATDAITLELADGDLFGGHTISVELADDTIVVDLVG